MKVKAPVRRGNVLIYGFFGMSALLGMAVLSVDYGRVQVAQSEVQAATDAAVRAAGQRMIDGGDIGQIHAAAVGAASANTVDGKPIAVRARNVQIGVYEPTSRQFTPTGDPRYANAVRVSLDYTFGTDGSPLSFIGAIGGQTKTVAHRATVMTDDVPGDWHMVRSRIVTPGSITSTEDEIVTEEYVLEYYRLIREENERRIREENERREAAERARRTAEETRRRAEEARRVAAEAERLRLRDAAEAANPALRTERLEREAREARERAERETREREERIARETRERIERETREREERERVKVTETTVTPGTTTTTPGTVEEREEREDDDDRPRRRVRQVE